MNMLRRNQVNKSIQDNFKRKQPKRTRNKPNLGNEGLKIFMNILRH